MRIGLDFDNTIAGYDHLFLALAKKQGWLDCDFIGNKKVVRDAVRMLPDGDLKWQVLQGKAYGPHMHEACLLCGVSAFLKICHKRHITVFIVSHKTQHSKLDPLSTDLRKVATEWMKNQGFFAAQNFGLLRKNVFFESTRINKIERITSLDLHYFIDDLEEVFLEPCFPETVHRYLYAAGRGYLPEGPFKPFDSWDAICNDIFGANL